MPVQVQAGTQITPAQVDTQPQPVTLSRLQQVTVKLSSAQDAAQALTEEASLLLASASASSACLAESLMEDTIADLLQAQVHIPSQQESAAQTAPAPAALQQVGVQASTGGPPIRSSRVGTDLSTAREARMQLPHAQAASQAVLVASAQVSTRQTETRRPIAAARLQAPEQPQHLSSPAVDAQDQASATLTVASSMQTDARLSGPQMRDSESQVLAQRLTLRPAAVQAAANEAKVQSSMQMDVQERLIRAEAAMGQHAPQVFLSTKDLSLQQIIL